jgi:hypothetical protein
VTPLIQRVRPISLPQLLARQRIPSGQYSDPLSHIFDEFDRNHDGALSASEVAAALRSRQVEITDEQAGGHAGWGSGLAVVPCKRALLRCQTGSRGLTLT